MSARSLMRVTAFLTVLLGSILAGFLIGTLQHYVGFGIWGYGFGKEPLQLACFEGGGGGFVGIPTGLITYYVVLKTKVTDAHRLEDQDC